MAADLIRDMMAKSYEEEAARYDNDRPDVARAFREAAARIRKGEADDDDDS